MISIRLLKGTNINSWTHALALFRTQLKIMISLKGISCRQCQNQYYDLLLIPNRKAFRKPIIEEDTCKIQ